MFFLLIILILVDEHLTHFIKYAKSDKYDTYLIHAIDAFRVNYDMIN